MKINSLEKFSDAQAGAGTDTTVVSTNVKDTGAGRDYGRGEHMWVNVYTGAAASGGTSVQVILQTSDAENFGSGVVEYPLTGALPVASVTANKKLVQQALPRGLKRYIRLAYKNVGAVTAVTYTSFLTLGVPQAEDNIVPAPYVI